MARGLVWFREDLRVKDNTALTKAFEENSLILGVYIIDHQMWKAHDVAHCRIEFILRNLKALYEALIEKNILLLTIEIKHSSQTISVIEDIIAFYNIDTLYFNEQYELNEAKRDTHIKTSLRTPTKAFTDQVIFHPKQLLTQSKTPYTIYTPYKRIFLQNALDSTNIIPLKSIAACASLLPKFFAPLRWHEQEIILHNSPPNKLSGYASDIPEHYWPGGEIAAHKRLMQFVEEKISNYHHYRDMPAQKATSKLSAYLTNGVLSPRQCFSAAMAANKGGLQGKSEGVNTWINELVWREFYKQLIANFPKLSMHQAFKMETENWPWRRDKKLFDAWAAGQTGYPLIDAAMRQLHQTGWMHNRLRMVVAMFLTKDCFIDWRLGEQYFMQHLIDGDLAANNGGWQWAASTGCDAVPYFRIFNPIRQSERFDPEGLFIKQYCPELAHLDSKIIHDPFKLPNGVAYPSPIVDNRKTRHHLLSILKNNN